MRKGLSGIEEAIRGKAIVKEPNLLIEAKQKFTKDEGIVWFWLLARAKFYKDFSLVKELIPVEVENLKEEGKLFLAKSLIDLRELAEKYPEVFDRKTIHYFKQVLKRMEKKVMFEVDIDRYLKTMEELGYKIFVSNLKRKDITYFGIATILQILMTKEGKLEIVFSPYISPLIFELKKRFTLYDFEEVLKLNSRYSIIMYRLLKEKFGLKINDFRLDLEEIRNILDLTSKIQASDIRNKYLLPAIKELNEKTSLKVEMTPIRRGRGGKIVGFRFKVEEKPRLEKVTEKDLVENFNLLKDWFKKAVEELTQDLSVQGPVQKLDIVNALLNLRYISPAVAIWFLLHYPRGEARFYAWEHINWVENNAKIKLPEKYLKHSIQVPKKELEFLWDQRVKHIAWEVLKSLKEEWEKKEPKKDLKKEVLKKTSNNEKAKADDPFEDPWDF